MAPRKALFPNYFSEFGRCTQCLTGTALACALPVPAEAIAGDYDNNGGRTRLKQRSRCMCRARQQFTCEQLSTPFTLRVSLDQVRRLQSG